MGAKSQEDKAYSAPLPLRAIGDPRLAGLDLRVLACIAAHDRMSLKLGSGRGCDASHETLAAKVGCNYINLGKSIKKLAGYGYLECGPKPGDRRAHVYRIPAALYDYDECLSFHQPSEEARANVATKKVGQTAHEGGEMVCREVEEKHGESGTSHPEYISRSDETYSVETGKNTPLKRRDEGRASQDWDSFVYGNGGEGSEAAGLGEEERGPSVNAELARFERAFKAGRFEDDGASLLGWVKWLEGVQEDYCGEPVGYQAQRLCENAVEALPEDLFRQWQEDDSPRTVYPIEAMIGGEPDAIRLQVAAFYEQADKPVREALARRAGLPVADLRGFVQGRVSLPIGKQMALRTAAKEAA